jgi:hypothetical protein
LGQTEGRRAKNNFATWAFALFFSTLKGKVFAAFFSVSGDEKRCWAQVLLPKQAFWLDFGWQIDFSSKVKGRYI